MKYFKEESKKEYYTSDTTLTEHQIMLGCMMRVADSLELIAKNYSFLISDVNYYKKTSEQYRDRVIKHARGIAFYRGYLKRMKKEKSNLRFNRELLDHGFFINAINVDSGIVVVGNVNTSVVLNFNSLDEAKKIADHWRKWVLEG